MQAAKSTLNVVPTVEFDLQSISPREIDLVIKALRGKGVISDNQVFQLRQYGADYLSSQPDVEVSEHMLATLEQQVADEKAGAIRLKPIKMCLNPFRNWKSATASPWPGLSPDP